MVDLVTTQTHLTARPLWQKLGCIGKISFRTVAFNSLLPILYSEVRKPVQNMTKSTLKSYKIFTRERNNCMCVQGQISERQQSQWKQWPKLLLLACCCFQHSWTRTFWHLVFNPQWAIFHPTCQGSYHRSWTYIVKPLISDLSGPVNEAFPILYDPSINRTRCYMKHWGNNNNNKPAMIPLFKCCTVQGRDRHWNRQLKEHWWELRRVATGGAGEMEGGGKTSQKQQSPGYILK